jgi:hypothetical protein
MTFQKIAETAASVPVSLGSGGAIVFGLSGPPEVQKGYHRMQRKGEGLRDINARAEPGTSAHRRKQVVR